MNTQDPTSNVLDFPSKSSRPSVELIPFGSNRTFEAVRSSGQGHLILKPLIESFGINWEGQRKWLQRQAWATTSILEAVGADGKVREMVTLPISRAAMLFATMDASKVADPQLREDVARLQCEGADVLDRWWRGASFVRPAEVILTPVDSFGRLEEWNRMQRHLAIAGETLNILKDDGAAMKQEQAEIKRKLDAQLEYIEILDQKVNRGLTAEQREDLVKAIWSACECRVSERERLMLEHVAKHGPATSLVRIGAAAKVTNTTARDYVDRLFERTMLDFEQRDPAMPRLRNYFVIADGLQGHAETCDFAVRALEKMLEMTSVSTMQQVGMIGHAPAGTVVVRADDGTAVHVVPPNIPHIPQPQLALQEIESSIPAGMSEREELMKTVRGICYHNGLDYHDFMSKLYIRMKFEGMDCKKTKKTSRIDYMERHNWCGIAKQMAEKMPIHEIRQAQNVGHA